VDPAAKSTRRPSIKDVAQLAGVSSKTVSNVLHGQIFVAEPTKARVTQAIAELGYRPNLNARSLRSGRSGILAVAVPDVDIPYFAELTGHLVKAAREHGYTVLIDETSGSRDLEVDLLTGIAPRLADGVIMSPQGTGKTQLREVLSDGADQDRTPTVLLGEHILGLPVDHVLIDNVAAAAEATQHLVDLGCRRIAAVGLPPGYDDQQEHATLRLKGYKKALKANKLEYDPELVVAGSARRPADGASAMGALLALPERPDAVFCFTDLLALGVVRELSQRRIRVPEDIAVVGFDNISHTRYSVPTITTIAPDKVAIAETAVRLLVDRLSGDQSAPRVVTVSHELVVRESTTRKRAARVG
jgi:DNA-binding LacI/PurR family transcriptional regulator